MRPITIRNHQELKNALRDALTNYDALPAKKWYNLFSAPGDDGRARAAYITTQLAIAEDNAKLEVLFAAIVQSKIFSSTQARLKNLLLDALIAKKNSISISTIAVKTAEGTFLRCAREISITLAANKIFRNLGDHMEVSSTPCCNPESGEEFMHFSCDFSRTDALKNAADYIISMHGDAVSLMTHAINTAPETQKKAAKSGEQELVQLPQVAT